MCLDVPACMNIVLPGYMLFVTALPNCCTVKGQTVAGAVACCHHPYLLRHLTCTPR